MDCVCVCMFMRFFVFSLFFTPHLSSIVIKMVSNSSSIMSTVCALVLICKLMSVIEFGWLLDCKPASVRGIRQAEENNFDLIAIDFTQLLCFGASSFLFYPPPEDVMCLLWAGLGGKSAI